MFGAGVPTGCCHNFCQYSGAGFVVAMDVWLVLVVKNGAFPGCQG